jgi:quercetin dioxygenase-like cupin family protein
MKLSGLLLIIAAFAMAGDSGEVDLWHGAKVVSEALPAGPGLQTAVLAKYGNHSVMVIRRQKTGQVELHQTQTDIMIVESGSGELRTGGMMADAKTTAPNELRSDEMKGGTSRRVAPGDIIHIPAHVSHQVVLKPGETISYVTIKVDAH